MSSRATSASHGWLAAGAKGSMKSGSSAPYRARTGAAGGCALLALLLLSACQPTVAVQAPKEPITINLNIKLDADIRVRLEEQAKKDIETNPGIF